MDVLDAPEMIYPTWHLVAVHSSVARTKKDNKDLPGINKKIHIVVEAAMNLNQPAMIDLEGPSSKNHRLIKGHQCKY